MGPLNPILHKGRDLLLVALLNFWPTRKLFLLSDSGWRVAMKAFGEGE